MHIMKREKDGGIDVLEIDVLGWWWVAKGGVLGGWSSLMPQGD